MISGVCFESGNFVGSGIANPNFQYPFKPKILISGGLSFVPDKKEKTLCGIYAISGLYESETVKTPVYIGSSNNISRRFFKEHIRELRSDSHYNPVIQFAWKKHKENNFVFWLLEQCKEDIQFEREQFYLDQIRPFADENRGYNISHSASGGDGYPGSPFLLKTPDGNIIEGINLKKFARENGLKFATIHKIASGKNQNSKGWTCPKYVFEKKPRKNAKKIKIKILKWTKKSGELKSPSGEIIKFNSFRSFSLKYKVSYKGLKKLFDKDVLNYKGWSLPESNYVHLEKGYEIESPEGIIYKFKKFREFGKTYNLHHYSISQLIKGKILSHKGWRLPGVKIQEKIFEIKSPDGEIYKFNNITKFAKDNKLNRGCLRDVLNKKQKHHKEWTLKSSFKIKNQYKIISPSGEVFIFDSISLFAKKHNLNKGNIFSLLKGKIKHHKGWVKYGCEYKRSVYKLINPDGFLITFRSIRDFCRNNSNIGRHYIKLLLDGKINSYHGYSNYKE